MVPNKLTIENFKSSGTLLNPSDLNGVHIVCLSGQNGHGKSSLLDAICWAIWGDEVHRPQDELVKHGENDMRVELEFYSDGYFQKTEGRNLYKVIRRFSRRKGSRSGATSLELYVSQTRKVNTELDFQVLTGNTIRDTQSSIFKLVGMDYRTFINSAFLLQGRSDEFTNSTPALRQRTLGEILQLDYFDKLQELAREKIRELRSTKTTLELQINTLEEQVSRFTQEEIELNVLSSDLVQIEKNTLEIQPLLENRKQDFLLIEEIETKISKLLIDKKTIVDDLNIFNKQLIALQKTFSDYLNILEKREVINENFFEIDRIRNKLQQNNNLVGPYSSLTERKKTLENGLVRFNEIQRELVKLQENLI